MRAIFGILLAGSLAADAPRTWIEECQVKAVFLYNFAKFVEWPATMFASSSDPVVICVSGRSPFGAVLDRTVRGKTVGGRAIEVRPFTDKQPVDKCHMLFVPVSERKRAWAVLNQVAATGVLTVGETDEFMAIGGMVNLKLDGTRVRIQIARDAVEHAKLVISSKLLTLAEIVRE